MENTILETYQNGKQLLGSDFSTIIKGTGIRKIKNAINAHIDHLYRLSNIKPYLKDGPLTIIIRLQSTNEVLIKNSNIVIE